MVLSAQRWPLLWPLPLKMSGWVQTQMLLQEVEFAAHLTGQFGKQLNFNSAEKAVLLKEILAEEISLGYFPLIYQGKFISCRLGFVTYTILGDETAF